MSAALLDRAARCEAATGPDRDLDRRIAAASGRAVWKNGSVWMTREYRPPSGRERSPKPVDAPVPDYTGSIDAALTLVPEGWSWGLSHESERSDGRTFASVRRYWSSFDRDHFCWAATPALALCAAALRARAAEKTDDR